MHNITPLPSRSEKGAGSIQSRTPPINKERKKERKMYLLPEDDRPAKRRQPPQRIHEHQTKVDHDAHHRQETRGGTKRRRPAIRPPRSRSIEEESPDEEGKGEEEGEGGVADAADGVAEVFGALVGG